MIETPTPVKPPEQWLACYDQHLERVCGAASATRYTYDRFARMFIELRFGSGPLDWVALTADDIVKFVTDQAASRRGFGRKQPGNAIRAMLRFLVASGLVRDGMQAAVPRIRQWKHASLPRKLTPDQVEKVLSTETGLRNRAILTMLARLGIRAKEVVELEMDAIDWQQAHIVVKSNKTRCERMLPLSLEVGSVLAEYLTTARPQSTSRRVFLSHEPPFEPLVGASAISSIARRALLRIGVPKGPLLGAHTFRHTAATIMVCNGASFKQVADVLGHRSISTTAIYAKLDIKNLAAVAMPLPGGSR